MAHEDCRELDLARQRYQQCASAAAFYQEGEVHRLQGDFAAAEEAYRNANELGLEPQP